MTMPTDWDAYYKKPAATSGPARKISQRKIVGLFLEHIEGKAASLCECGGANSCFADALLTLSRLNRYHIIDSNAYGVSLLEKRYASDERVSWEVGDLLRGAHQPFFDIVYSVGLIEHFDRKNTARCVDAHFALCKPGGVILITFPTPTIPYRVIRGAAEALGIWAFPDERPLDFVEVEAAAERHRPVLLHRSINWMIGLTQGYLMYRK